MLVEEPQENELNLEKIDMEIRMEKIRQHATKLSWGGFGEAVRRNLLEKRIGFDADGRLDVIHAISFMRKKMPVDDNGSIQSKIQLLADSLECSLKYDSNRFLLQNQDVCIEIGHENEEIVSCKIGYWGDSLFDADDGVKMLMNGEFANFRNSVFGIVGLLPINASNSDRNVCKEALLSLEQLLVRDASDSSFNAINSSKFGFFCPRTALRSGRLYYVCEPMIMAQKGKTHADIKDLEMLPSIELSFAAHDRPTKMPRFNWNESAEAKACVCLRFNGTRLFSHETTKRLEHMIAKSPLVRHYTNCYRYMSGKDQVSDNLELTTRFPDGHLQQKYEIDVQSLTMENDPVVVEMYIKDLRMLEEVVSVLRSEWMHNSLWESILASCQCGARPKSMETVTIKTTLQRKLFEFVFATSQGLVNVIMEELKDGEWTVRTVESKNGESVDAALDRRMTKVLRRCWSIPATLNVILKRLECEKSAVMEHEEINENCCVIGEDKVSSAWLGVVDCGSGVRSRNKCAYERQQDEHERGSLLASFADVAGDGRKAEGRLRRVEENNSNVFSDFERIRMLAEEGEDDTRKSPPPQPVRLSLDSPPQMSPLESARIQMKQAVGAATAVALASVADDDEEEKKKGRKRRKTAESPKPAKKMARKSSEDSDEECDPPPPPKKIVEPPKEEKSRNTMADIFDDGIEEEEEVKKNSSSSEVKKVKKKKEKKEEKVKKKKISALEVKKKPESPKIPAGIIPTLSIKNFRIPKKETNEEKKTPPVPPPLKNKKPLPPPLPQRAPPRSYQQQQQQQQAPKGPQWVRPPTHREQSYSNRMEEAPESPEERLRIADD